MVLQTLTSDDLARVAQGALLLDSLTRDYIREHLSYRWLETADGDTALTVERTIQEGALDVGRPFLNPGG